MMLINAWLATGNILEFGSTQRAAAGEQDVDTSWAWPSDEENKFSFNHIWTGSGSALNGFRPFHQSAATFFLNDVGYPAYDSKGNFLQFIKLPGLKEIALAVWNILPKTVQKSIHDWADKGGDSSMKSIADAIYEVVKDVLASVFHIPTFVIKVTLGVLIPRLVIWFVANIKDLPIKDS
jgi:hypothetical protein